MARQQEIIASVDQSCLHPSGKFTVYRLVIQMFSNNGERENITYKRFSDFVRLHRQLLRVHKAFGGLQRFPTLSKFDRFNRFNPRLIEERRQALDSFVKFIAWNEHLYCHTYFTRFVAGGFSDDFPSRSNSSADNFVQSFSNLGVSSSAFSNNFSDSLASLNAISEELAAPNELVWPPPSKSLEQFESPLSSDADSEQEGDTLPLLWMHFEPKHSKIVQDITLAKKFVLSQNWSEAYKGYKDAISSLLKEIGSCREGIEEYRCLLSACLAKAESIYREHFENNLPENLKCKADVSHANPTWMEPQNLASLCQDPALSKLFGSVEELSKLKICGIDRNDISVCDGVDSSIKLTLKSLSLSLLNRAPSIAPVIASTDFKTSIPAKCILPVGKVAFMSPLLRLLESPDHSCVFLLVKRAKGGLRLVDWLSNYLQRRICSLLRPMDSSGIHQRWRNPALALKHLDWCKTKSSRIRELIEKCLKESEENPEIFHESSSVKDSPALSKNTFGSSSASSPDELHRRDAPLFHLKPMRCSQTRFSSKFTILSSHLFTPTAVLRRHPPHISLPLSRSLSFTDRLPFLGDSSYDEDCFTLQDDKAYVHQCMDSIQVHLLPERRCILWAAQLVSVVSWLHEHHITLRHLDRSRVYLTNHGNIEIDYFFRWTDSDVIDEYMEDLSSYAPELLIGDLSRTFLCSGSREKCMTCDWWSVGVLLYEVFTGLQLREVYPHGLSCNEPLQLPSTLSSSVGDFLSKLLKLNPNERLSGSTVKDHPVFAFVDWSFTEEGGLK